MSCTQAGLRFQSTRGTKNIIRVSGIINHAADRQDVKKKQVLSFGVLVYDDDCDSGYREIELMMIAATIVR
jgi:hypothetical protein